MARFRNDILTFSTMMEIQRVLLHEIPHIPGIALANFWFDGMKIELKATANIVTNTVNIRSLTRVTWVSFSFFFSFFFYYP